MNNSYSSESQIILEMAQENAKRYKHGVVGSEHILLALASSTTSYAGQLLNDFGITADKVSHEIEKYTGFGTASSNAEIDTLPYSPKAKEILDHAMEIASKNRFDQVEPLHILLASLDDETIISSRIISSLDVNNSTLIREIWSRFRVRNIDQESRRGATRQPAGTRTSEDGRNNQGAKKEERAIEKYSRDLTQLAREGKLETAIGRETEIARVIQILSRKTKNNPVLVGEAGVGKTAIVEGLAKLITEGKVPGVLRDKKILSLDLTGLVAGTKYRGEFEERIQKIINEVRDDRSIILFIDELHNLIGAGGSEGAADASNILKPALSRGEFQTIGATTFDEYQKYIQKDGALERRFASVTVEEPTEEQTELILRGLRDSYEEFHKIKISDEAIDAAVKLSSRYITDRFLPDKAIDLIDEASARVRIEQLDESEDEEDSADDLETQIEQAVLSGDISKALKLKNKQLDDKVLVDDKHDKDIPVVTAHDIAIVVSQSTGIPMNQMESSDSQRLLKLEEELGRRVIGQKEAVSAVARSVRRSGSGIKDPRRPIGTFLFLGTTGVGKTELAKALAASMFGSEDNMIRLDMSEFQEKISTSRLVGAAPGYVGFEEGGQLTEAVRRHPYSVILLDEVEKANTDVYNLLLQVFDDGFLTDSRGRKVDFRNTIIIMTSNLGATRLRDNKTMGFGADNSGQSYEKIEAGIKESLKEYFRPEFLNRIDETVIFQPLDAKELRKIVTIMSKGVLQRLAERGIGASIDKKALDLVSKEGFDPEFGARPIRRAFQRLVEDKLTNMILANELRDGDKIKITAVDDEIVVEIKNSKQDDKEQSSKNTTTKKTSKKND